MKKLQPPRFLNDLYRDLRDRRLLIPVAGLLVAIVAVPFLLNAGSSAPPPPPAPAAAAHQDSANVAPAVLVTDTGVRDYKKRLAELKKTNPFKQKYALPTPKSVALEKSGSSSSSPSSSSTAPPATTSSGDASTSIDTTVTDTSTGSSSSGSVTTDTTVTTDGTGSTASSGPQTKPPKPEVRFYAGRIDVTVGQLGDANRLDDVRYLDLLPNDKAPVVAFLGLANGAQGAVFSVSRDVVETDGDGTCAPKKPAPCEFLTLNTGDQETLKLADGTTYRLRLLHTHVVRVPDPRDENGSDQPSSTGG
jgi:hypothetical protein